MTDFNSRIKKSLSIAQIEKNSDRQKSSTEGFTIIETVLAMLVLSFVLITVIVVLMSMMQIQNKGITMRNVNGVVRHISRDLRDSVTAAPQPISLVEYNTDADGNIAPGETKKELADLMTDSGGEMRNLDIDYFNDEKTGGRLCTGSYTYVWNYQGALRNGSSGLQTVNGEPVNFVKVQDRDKELCRPVKATDSGVELRGNDITGALSENITPVMGDGERDLRIYGFSIEEGGIKYKDIDGATKHDTQTRYFSTFYNIKLVIGSSLYNEEYLGSHTDKQIAEGVSLEDGSENEIRCGSVAGDSTAEYCALNVIEVVALAGSANN